MMVINFNSWITAYHIIKYGMLHYQQLHGFNPQANYINQATAACQRR
jgi:hypothetical protein